MTTAQLERLASDQSGDTTAEQIVHTMATDSLLVIVKSVLVGGLNPELQAAAKAQLITRMKDCGRSAIVDFSNNKEHIGLCYIHTLVDGELVTTTGTSTSRLDIDTGKERAQRRRERGEL